MYYRVMLRKGTTDTKPNCVIQTYTTTEMIRHTYMHRFMSVLSKGSEESSEESSAKQSDSSSWRKLEAPKIKPTLTAQEIEETVWFEERRAQADEGWRNILEDLECR
jgi:hypothetical protein